MHLEPSTAGRQYADRTPATVAARALGHRMLLNTASHSGLPRGQLADGHVQFDTPVPPYLCRTNLHFGDQSRIELDQVDHPETGR